MLINNNCFTEFGKAWKRGDFARLNPYSYEYTELWKEQAKRCREGYSVGGKYCSGKLYGYVNFGTIELLENDDISKNWIERENNRIVYAINFGDDSEAAVGKSADIFLVDEVGMANNLIDYISSSEPCWKDGNRVFGFFMGCGTGGDMDSGS